MTYYETTPDVNENHAVVYMPTPGSLVFGVQDATTGRGVAEAYLDWREVAELSLTLLQGSLEVGEVGESGDDSAALDYEENAVSQLEEAARIRKQEARGRKIPEAAREAVYQIADGGPYGFEEALGYLLANGWKVEA